MTNPPARSRSPALGMTADDIMRLLYRCDYATPRQLAYALGSLASLDYYRGKGKELVDDGYLLRLFAPRSQPVGRAESVFTLASKGYRYLRQQGLEVARRLRPSEELRKSGSAQLLHSLALTDWIIAQDKLAGLHPEIVVGETLSERDFRREPLKVTIAEGRERLQQRRYNLQPDGLFSLTIAKRIELRYALELDRGHSLSAEYQRQIRRKTAAYLAAAGGPYQERFDETLNVAFVAVNGRTRRETLRRWIAAEIKAQQATEQAEIFLITDRDPAQIDPDELFLSSCWYRPGAEQPQPLIHPEVQQLLAPACNDRPTAVELDAGDAVLFECGSAQPLRRGALR